MSGPPMRLPVVIAVERFALAAPALLSAGAVEGATAFAQKRRPRRSGR